MSICLLPGKTNHFVRELARERERVWGPPSLRVCGNKKTPQNRILFIMLHVRACVCTRVLQCAKLIIPYWGVLQFLVRFEKITDTDKKRKCCFWGMRKCTSVCTCFCMLRLVYSWVVESGLQQGYWYIPTLRNTRWRPQAFSVHKHVHTLPPA